ncbi:uncharacterized protein LOC142635582 [Castanea sativa]|uniref:uncharacterized protein LOC142635582 n=1 Tax=Castanea sativa TaxID=21020 RepID=UPI003F64CEED
MIDQGSGADVMYPDLYRGLGLKNGDLSKYDTPLMGFDGHMVTPEWQISLPVIIGGREVIVTFIVVASFSPYTAIFGRPWIHDMGAIPSTLHVKVKFRTDEGITIGVGLNDRERVQLLLFLIQNVDVFAWNPYEVPGDNPEFIVHKLNVDPLCPPKKRKPRRSAKEHVEAVRQKVGKLREVRAIKETFFTEWLANTMVMKKKTRSVSNAENRSIGGRYMQAPKNEFPQCLPGLSPDCPSSRGSGENGIFNARC